MELGQQQPLKNLKIPTSPIGQGSDVRRAFMGAIGCDRWSDVWVNLSEVLLLD
jgi:hypothetical protein